MSLLVKKNNPSLTMKIFLICVLFLSIGCLRRESSSPREQIAKSQILSVESLPESKKGFSPISDDSGMEDLNFGVLVQNEKYQIYRSEKLGEDGLETVQNYFKKRNWDFPKTIIYMNDEGYEPFYEFAVEEAKLQKKYGYQFYHSFGYQHRTYLDGYNPYNPQDDIDDRFFTSLIIENFGPTPPDQVGQVDGDMDSLMRIMNLILDPKNQPVLFHCWGGRHRTGMVAMIIRQIQGGIWSKSEHQVTFKSGRKMTLDRSKFEYTLHNAEKIRIANFHFMDRFLQDDRFLQMRQKYQADLR